MAKASFLLFALLSLFVVSECTSSYLTSLRETIVQRAQQCCGASCSAEAKSMIKADMDFYAAKNGPNAQQTKELVEASLADGACSGRSKRANYATVSCDSTPMDVTNGPAKVSCSLAISIDNGIFYASASAQLILPSSGTINIGADRSYYDAYNTSKIQTLSFSFNLPRYAADGLWTVVAYAYGPGYTPYVQGNGNFTVKKTVNDVSPPVITALGPSLLMLNDTNKSIYVAATDDLSGVLSITVYLYTLSGYSVAYASSYLPSGSLPQRSLGVLVPLYQFSDITPGTYRYSVSISDANGATLGYDYVRLTQMGLSPNVTIDSNNCPANTYRAYGTTGACTSCPLGTYAPVGAFKCRSCPPGTSGSTAPGLCTACPAGTYGIGASWACSGCNPGTYSSLAGQAVCTPCSAGSNTTQYGASACGYCPAGTYSTGGQDVCTPCPPGTSSSGFGYSCNKCAPGRFAALSGSVACPACPVNTYSGAGATSCSACPAPRVNGPAASGSPLNCYQ